MEQACDNCKHFNYIDGSCRYGLADELQCRDCTMDKCSKWEEDPFFKNWEQ